MSPAAVVRAHLAEARERGEPFARAWHDAMDALALEAPDTPEPSDQRRERECWLAALRWAAPRFRRAYYRRPPALEESAAAALEEAA